MFLKTISRKPPLIPQEEHSLVAVRLWLLSHNLTIALNSVGRNYLFTTNMLFSDSLNPLKQESSSLWNIGCPSKQMFADYMNE